jgi:hypothetical protein
MSIENAIIAITFFTLTTIILSLKNKLKDLTQSTEDTIQSNNDTIQSQSRVTNAVVSNLIHSMITQHKLTDTSTKKLVGVFNPTMTTDNPKFQFVCMDPESISDLSVYFGDDRPTTKIFPGKHNLNVISNGLNEPNRLASCTLQSLNNHIDPIIMTNGYVLVYSDNNSELELKKLMDAMNIHLMEKAHRLLLTLRKVTS